MVGQRVAYGISLQMETNRKSIGKIGGNGIFKQMVGQKVAMGFVNR